MLHPEPLVSVIIPVYNTGHYVETCMRSVIDQTYRNLEIIVVNDGSTDNSRQIIEKYAGIDSRIILINKSNEGLPLARRSGIEVATGKYIQHLDSDDDLIADAIERLVEKAEDTGAGIVAAPFFFCNEGEPKKLSTSLSFKELSGTEYLSEIFHERAYWSVWSNFQKRSLFTDHKIEVVPSIYYGEDVILMIQLLMFDPKVVALDTPILNYNRFSTSITCSINDEKYKNYRAYKDWIEHFLDAQGRTGQFEEGLAILHLRTTFTSIRWKHLEDVRKDMKRLIRYLKHYPDLKALASRRELKIISVFRVSAWLGYLNLKRYQKQGKI